MRQHAVDGLGKDRSQLLGEPKMGSSPRAGGCRKFALGLAFRCEGLEIVTEGHDSSSMETVHSPKPST